MRDGDVRQALYLALSRDHEHELDTTRFVDELDLCGQVRVDVAVLNGALSGYELKSASDSLRRLPVQIDLYSQVLDFATLVVAGNHAVRAQSILPDWWGCTIAHWVDDAVELEPIRAPAPNPSVRAASLAMLLWRDEALAELEAHGLAAGRRSWTRRRLCESLAEDLPLDVLRRAVRERLKGREGWRSDR